MANIMFPYASGTRGLGCAACDGVDAPVGLGGLGDISSIGRVQPYLDDYSFGEEVAALEPLEPLPRSEPPRRRKRRVLREGATVWCVFLGKGKKARKKSCHQNKFSAEKAARSLRAKRYSGSPVSVRKGKHKMKCPFGGRRVCRVKKRGKCVKHGCSGMKKGK